MKIYFVDIYKINSGFWIPTVGFRICEPILYYSYIWHFASRRRPRIFSP